MAEGDVAAWTANSRLNVVRVVLSCRFNRFSFGTGDDGSSASFSTLGILLLLTVALTISSSEPDIRCPPVEDAARVERGRGRLDDPVSSEVEGVSAGKNGSLDEALVDLEGEPLEKRDGRGILELSEGLVSNLQDAMGAVRPCSPCLPSSS